MRRRGIGFRHCLLGGAGRERTLNSRMRERAPPPAAASEAVLEFKVLSRRIAFKQSMPSRGLRPLVSHVSEPGQFHARPRPLERCARRCVRHPRGRRLPRLFLADALRRSAAASPVVVPVRRPERNRVSGPARSGGGGRQLGAAGDVGHLLPPGCGERHQGRAQLFPGRMGVPDRRAFRLRLLSLHQGADGRRGALNGAKFVPSLLAMEPISFATCLYPATLLVLNAAVSIMLLARRRALGQRAPKTPSRLHGR